MRLRPVNNALQKDNLRVLFATHDLYISRLE